MQTGIHHNAKLGIEAKYEIEPPYLHYPVEIRITDILINGDEIPLDLEAFIIEGWGEYLENEIKRGL